MNLSLKASFRGEHRRFSLARPRSESFDSVRSRVAQLYRLDSAAVRLSYVDEDGDTVALSADDELEEAVRLAAGVLRLTVTDASAPPASPAAPASPLGAHLEALFNAAVDAAGVPRDVAAQLALAVPPELVQQGVKFMEAAAGAAARRGMRRHFRCGPAPPVQGHPGHPAAGGVAVHPRVQCDGCDMLPLRGLRFKSTILDDYDLCSSCFEKVGSPEGFAKVDAPAGRGPRAGAGFCPRFGPRARGGGGGGGGCGFGRRGWGGGPAGDKAPAPAPVPAEVLRQAEAALGAHAGDVARVIQGVLGSLVGAHAAAPSPDAAAPKEEAGAAAPAPAPEAAAAEAVAAVPEGPVVMPVVLAADGCSVAVPEGAPEAEVCVVAEDLGNLCAMGFDEDLARIALVLRGGATAEAVGDLLRAKQWPEGVVQNVVSVTGADTATCIKALMQTAGNQDAAVAHVLSAK